MLCKKVAFEKLQKVVLGSSCLNTLAKVTAQHLQWSPFLKKLLGLTLGLILRISENFSEQRFVEHLWGTASIYCASGVLHLIILEFIRYLLVNPMFLLN